MRRSEGGAAARKKNWRVKEIFPKLENERGQMVWPQH